MKLYNDYNSYLKEKYGCKVYRIGLDAGFTCPNRDGTKGTLGCIYCNAGGSRASYADPHETIERQLESRIAYLKKNKKAQKFIAYFQAFTNTYAPAEKLKKVYDKILRFDDMVGISIGTRPDAVDHEKLALISSYKAHHDVWIEYGLQTVHERTLSMLNRGSTFADFVKALDMTRPFDISVSAHVILGLPGESPEDMIETARRLSSLKVSAVKIHLLHVLKGSVLETLYREGKVKLLGQDEYVKMVCEFLKNLSPDILVQRLTGEGTKGDHIAPTWALDKTETIKRIEETLKGEGGFQGAAISGSRPLSCRSSGR